MPSKSFDNLFKNNLSPNFKLGSQQNNCLEKNYNYIAFYIFITFIKNYMQTDHHVYVLITK